MRGKVVLIFFGFTACADVCPLTMAEVAAAMKALGEDSERVQALFISIDPKRDTPEVLRNYAPYFHRSILGLTGSQEEIDAVTRRYRSPVYARKPDESGYYVVDHGSYLYIVDTEGKLANLLRFGTPSDKIVSVIRALLDDET